MKLKLSFNSDGLAEIQRCFIDDFKLTSGHKIPQARLGYCVYGENLTNPVILVHPALSGSPRLSTPGGKASQGEGWWTMCVGPGKFLDTDLFTIICVDHFGGNGDSTGAEELVQLLPDYQDHITLTDTRNLVLAALKQFEIFKLHAVVGGSIGGGQTLEWLFQDQVEVERILEISGNCNNEGAAQEFFQIQADLLDRRVKHSIPALKQRLIDHCKDLKGQTRAFDIALEHICGGFDRLKETGPTREALCVARKLEFLRFVTPHHYEKKWSHELSRTQSEKLADDGIRSWLDHLGETFLKRFSAEALASLCRMESNSKIKNTKEIAVQIEKKNTRFLGFAVDGDTLFDAGWQFRFYQKLRAQLSNDQKDLVDVHFAFDEINGHDHFLTESFLKHVPRLKRHLVPLEHTEDFATRAIHEGLDYREETGAVIPPIYLTSTFRTGNSRGFDYTRSGNPNFVNLETAIASLEDAKYATVFGSGVSAITAVVSTLKSGDLVIAEEIIYGCTYRLFDKVFSKFGVRAEYLDFTKQEHLEEIVKKRPALVWLESPTNPLLKILDIREISKFTQRAGCPLLVDNTFASSYCQRPLDLGADLSLSSTTKYINGHSDCLGGVVCTDSPEWHEKLLFSQKALGLNPSPFDSWLISRGLKTLSLRMDRHAENALNIARALEEIPEIETVFYPFLKSNPAHEIAMRQMKSGSGIVSARLKFNKEKTMRFLKSLRRFTLAESLGGIESLVCHPATMSHASVPEHEKDRLGITDNLVRFSVGIEHWQDLLSDIKQALAAVKEL